MSLRRTLARFRVILVLIYVKIFRITIVFPIFVVKICAYAIDNLNSCSPNFQSQRNQPTSLFLRPHQESWKNSNVLSEIKINKNVQHQISYMQTRRDQRVKIKATFVPENLLITFQHEPIHITIQDYLGFGWFDSIYTPSQYFWNIHIDFGISTYLYLLHLGIC